MWDMNTGQCQHQLNGHTSTVTSVSFRSDGLQLASGSHDKTVRVWNMNTGQCQHQLNGHTSVVTSVSFRSDGLQLASVSWDETVRVWDMNTGQCQHQLNGHTDSVTSVSFRSDGLQLASGSNDNTVRVWDMNTGQCQHQLNGHTSYVTSVSFRSNGLQLASGSSDKTVRVWDMNTGQCQHQLNGHTSYVTSVSFRSDGLQLASGSNDNTVRVWDMNTGQCELNGHSDCVSLKSNGDKKDNPEFLLTWFTPQPHILSCTNTCFTRSQGLSTMNYKLMIQLNAKVDLFPKSSDEIDYKESESSFHMKHVESDNPLLKISEDTSVSLNPKFIDEKKTITKVINHQSHFIEKVLEFVDFCQLKVITFDKSFDKSASCSFISTIMRMIRKNELELILKEPENYGLPFSICKFIEKYLESNGVIFTLVENNIELCQKIE